MKSLLIVATIAIGGFSGNNYKNEMGVATEVITDKNLPVTTYVLNNMSTYNQARISEGYSATSLSFVKSCPIKTVEGEFIRGELVKFEDGYIVAGEDDEIHALSFINDVEINTNNEGVNRQSIAYFDIGGFREYDTGSKTWQHLDKTDTTADVLIHDGQYLDGYGYIYDPDAFVRDKYGSAANFISEKYITAPIGNLSPLNCYAYPLSLYKETVSETECYYEGIPQFVVALIVCDYIDKCFSTSYYPRDALIDYDVSTQDLASYYQDKIDSGFVPTNRQVSTLEAFLRAKAFTYFETPEYLNGESVMTLISGFDMSGRYPYTLNTFAEDNIGDYVDQIKEEVQNNNIGLVRFQISNTYGTDYSAALTGYRYYKKVSSFIGIKVTTNIWLMELRDGIYDTPVFFDATGGKNKVRMHFFEK